MQERLLKRKNGQVKKVKKPTVESVKKNIQNALNADYMQHLFETAVTEEEGHILLEFNFSTEKLEYVKERHLGKTLLFTNNHVKFRRGCTVIFSSFMYALECAALFPSKL